MDVNYLHFFIDTKRLKADVKKILKKRHMDYADLGRCIGYSESSITKYMAKSDYCSRFITASLLEHFKLSPKEYQKEGFKNGN